MAYLDKVSLGGTLYDVTDTKGRAMIAPKEETSTASAAHAIGTYFTYNDLLYRATTNIAVGDTITPNTNCVAVTVGAETSSLKSALKSEIDGLQVDDSNIQIELFGTAKSRDKSFPADRNFHEIMKIDLIGGKTYVVSVTLAQASTAAVYVYFIDENDNYVESNGSIVSIAAGATSNSFTKAISSNHKNVRIAIKDSNVAVTVSECAITYGEKSLNDKISTDKDNITDLISSIAKENDSAILCNQVFTNTGTNSSVWFNNPIVAGQYADGLYAIVPRTTGTTGTQTKAGYVRVRYSDETSDNTDLTSENVLYKIYINQNKTVSGFDFVGFRSSSTTTSTETSWLFIALGGSQIEKNRNAVENMQLSVDDLCEYSGVFDNIIEPTLELGTINVSDYALSYVNSTTICRVPSGSVYFGIPGVRIHLKDYTKYKFGYLYAGNNGNWYKQTWFSQDYVFPTTSNNDRKFTFVVTRIDGIAISEEEVRGQLQFIYPDSKALRDRISFYKTFSVKDYLKQLGLFFLSGNGLASGSTSAYTTDYIPVVPGMTIKCSLDVGENGRYSVCYYNATKTEFVSGVEGNQTDITLTVPDGAGYVRFCNLATSIGSAYIIFTDYVIPDQERVNINRIDNELVNNLVGTSYMQTGLARITSELKSKSNLGNLVVIGFNTDQHIWTDNQKSAVRRGLQVLSRLTRNYPYDFICLGGDACEGGSQADTLNEILDNCIEVQEQLYDAWCPVVPITGNHDAAQNNQNMTGAMLFNAHFKRIANSGFLEGWDSTHTNGYWDSEAHNIRFIFFDDTVRNDYTSTQRNNALSQMVTGTPEGYKIVIFSHHPLSQSLTDSHWQNPVYADDILVPYAGQIICCICGHSHADISETKNGILYIATTMAMYGTDQDGNTRTIGVEAETAFDTFVIAQAQKKIYALRYGYGSNRDWSYTVD